MNTAQRLFALLLLVLLPAFATAGATDITREELKARQAQNVATVFVDVRSPAEFAAGHVPGAINIPLDQVSARAGELAAHKDDGSLVLYCHSGRRAGLAATALEALGFSRLNHLVGDMPGWAGAGEPVEK